MDIVDSLDIFQTFHGKCGQCPLCPWTFSRLSMTVKKKQVCRANQNNLQRYTVFNESQSYCLQNLCRNFGQFYTLSSCLQSLCSDIGRLQSVCMTLLQSICKGVANGYFTRIYSEYILQINCKGLFLYGS